MRSATLLQGCGLASVLLDARDLDGALPAPPAARAIDGAVAAPCEAGCFRTRILGSKGELAGELGEGPAKLSGGRAHSGGRRAGHGLPRRPLLGVEFGREDDSDRPLAARGLVEGPERGKLLVVGPDAVGGAVDYAGAWFVGG